MLDAFVKAVRDHIRLVVIDLDGEDNAQVTFETLNARTTPLLSIDLVKNLVFRHAEQELRDDAAIDDLYRRTWQPFDTDHWHQDARQGRLKRLRSEGSPKAGSRRTRLCHARGSAARPGSAG